MEGELLRSRTRSQEPLTAGQQPQLHAQPARWQQRGFLVLLSRKMEPLRRPGVAGGVLVARRGCERGRDVDRRAQTAQGECTKHRSRALAGNTVEPTKEGAAPSS